jgi:hypothetical protein
MLGGGWVRDGVYVREAPFVTGVTIGGLNTGNTISWI